MITDKIKICNEYGQYNNIIIFGASTLGAVAYFTIKDSKNVVAFSDNDPKKHGGIFCGTQIIHPDKIHEYIKDTPDCTVLIASMYIGAISLQLSEMGVNKFFYFGTDEREIELAAKIYTIRNPMETSIYKNMHFSDERRKNNISDFSNFLDDYNAEVAISISTEKINYNKNKNKNILFIAYIFPPFGGSGVQRSSKFVKYLKKMGYNPIVVSALNTSFMEIPMDYTLLEDVRDDVSVIRIDDLYSGDNKPTKKEAYEICELLDGIVDNEEIMNAFIDNMRKYNIENIRINNFFAAWPTYVLRELDKILNFSKIGAIYTTSAPYFDHFIGFYLKKKYKIPWVADFRDEWTNNHVFKSTDNSKIEVMLEKRIAEETDALISVSKIATANFINICKISEEKVHCITNGYDKDDFLLAAKSKSSLNARQKKFIICFGGELYPSYYHIEEFYSAINELVKEGLIFKNDIEIEFFGNYTKYHKEVINNLDYHGITKISGYLEHIKSIIKLQNADVLLLFGGNDKSAYSGKVFEYIMMDKPILAIAPKGGLIDGLLAETKTGLCCDPNDAEEIKNALLKLYNRDGGINFHPDYDRIEKYSRESLTKELIKIFEEVQIEYFRP